MFILENITSGQRKLDQRWTANWECGVWHDLRTRGKEESREVKTSPFCTMQWRTAPCTGAENCYYGTWGRWNWKTAEDWVDYRMMAWHQLLFQIDSRCLFVITTTGLYNTGVWQYIPQSLKSSKFNISNAELLLILASASPFTGESLFLKQDKTS